MSVSFCHASAPLVAHDFGFFVEMVPANEVNTSSRTVSEIEQLIGWQFGRLDGGCYAGEIATERLLEFFLKCEQCLKMYGGDRCCAEMTSTAMNRIAALRRLAKQALHFNEPITYG